MKYRKKPVIIDAIRLGDEWPDWFADAVTESRISVHQSEQSGASYALITTLEGVMKANHDDYIIRGVSGEIYPCKPDIFVATYDPA